MPHFVSKQTQYSICNYTTCLNIKQCIFSHFSYISKQTTIIFQLIRLRAGWQFLTHARIFWFSTGSKKNLGLAQFPNQICRPISMTDDEDGLSFPFSSTIKNNCGYSFTPTHIFTTYCIITAGTRINFPFIAFETSFEHCNRNKVCFQMCRSWFLKYPLVNVRICMD